MTFLNQLKSFGLLISVLLIVACSDGDGDFKGRGSVSVSKGDFNISGTALSESQLLSILGDFNQRILLTNDLVNGDFSSSLLGFLDDSIFFGMSCDFMNPPTFSDNGSNEFALSYSANYLECLSNVPAPSPGVSIDSMLEALSVSQAIFSENSNPVDVSGQTWDDVSFTNYKIEKINFKYAYEYSGSQNGQSSTLAEKYAVYAADDFNKACEFQDTLITNCIIQYIDSFSASGLFDNTEVVTFEYDNIVPATGTSNGINPVYFASGSINFRVNNWSGTLLYSAPENAPTYTATDGVQNIQGTLLIY